MQSTSRERVTAALSRCCTLFAVVGFSLAAQAQPAGIAPDAQRLLKASTDFIASQNQLYLESRNSLEVVLFSGQKIEFNHIAKLSIQRPNKLRHKRLPIRRRSIRQRHKRLPIRLCWTRLLPSK